MTSVRCSQGHLNSHEGRFCYLCGERLSQPSSGHHPSDSILGLRYRIRRELGHGGFGRTYLAEDINRFNEPCVLKEFAPQVEGTYALQKAEELFGREAGILYKLQHPQIPQFRELFRATFEDRDHLFLVQDYIDGQTYQQLLETRKQQRGVCFSEVEATQLLVQLLPVLQYLHGIGVIHRDISPDNIILRSDDQMPVLIDFGGVKQISAAAAQYVQMNQAIAAPPTRLGKMGYAPDEQMQMGRAYPPSDLYALAVTVLVLLTGDDPQDLLSGSPRQNWQDRVHLSPTLIAVLTHMLASNPVDRYQSAEEVLQALAGNPFEFDETATQPPVGYTSPPLLELELDPFLSPPTQSNPTTALPNPTIAVPQSTLPQPKRRGLGQAVLPLFLLMGLAGAGWQTRDRWLPVVISQLNPPEAVEPGSDTSSNFPPSEQERKIALRDRREALKIDYQFLIDLTNGAFYDRYPDQQGRTLTDGAADAEWRTRWDAIANDLLTTLEQNLSAEARSHLGQYTQADRDRWKQSVNRLYVSSRALNDLADAKFFQLFPNQQDQNFIAQPIGQVWHAIAEDAVATLQAGRNLERVRFEDDSYGKQISGRLEPGDGRVYIANLSEGQHLRLNLQAPARSTLLSIYLPRPTPVSPFLLEDAAQRTWSGRLPQSGFYEVVIVSTTTEPFDYQLDLAIDRVTSTPIEAIDPESPDAKD
ncbi:serine/threonine protein kinase [Oculatella sp. LEGE 06141]|uniref:serine/threonine-protein kinase n=1 Tax=Oculatella sp. LEGE 06141 TaxID=1828648 RepID=UPI0018822688|nr:serine/threonine-protein kinase [Oculatella sp. LEGE 06141]MBE9179752.1 serine/threonine protein kinase [Oculatella sp. LEGE 06141]